MVILGAAFILRPMGFIEEMTMRMNQTVSDALLKGERGKVTSVAPSWMDTQTLNHRVWIGEDYTAMWWNIFFPIPDAKGYFHPIFTLDWSFWRDASIRISISGQASGDLKWPEPVVRNYALFHLDWFAIRYVADTYPPAKYYFEKGLAERQEKTYLYFTEMAGKPTILQATNAPAILVVSNRSGYDVVIRNLAMTDRNSQRCVLIRGPERLSAVSDQELKSFDAIILYGYDFTKDFSDMTRLARFVSEGGSLFIDAPAAAGDPGSAFPDPIPITTATTASPKGEWQFSSPDPQFFPGIDLQAFSPPLYDGGGWGVTLAPNEGAIKPWAKAVLGQAGNPIIVAGNLGKGKVIWSGLNLFYHSQQYNNVEEGKLVANFLDFVAPFAPSTPDFQARRLAPERAEVEGKDFNGVLFKENFYSGWSASLATPEGTRPLRVYPAGPDLMYVRLPSKSPSLAKVTFSFGGPPFDWFLFALGPIFVLLGLDAAVLKGRLFLTRTGRLFSDILSGLVARYRRWWTEEEEKS